MSPNVKELWRWIRKVVQDFYTLSKLNPLSNQHNTLSTINVSSYKLTLCAQKKGQNRSTRGLPEHRSLDRTPSKNLILNTETKDSVHGMAQGSQKVDYSDYKSDQNPYGIQPEVVTDEQDIVETLRRENDYMENLL